MKKILSEIWAPLLAAAIWGTAFACQNLCAEHVSPFFLNGLRYLVSAVVMFPLCLISGRKRKEPLNQRMVIMGSILCGIALAVSVNIQQFGIEESSAGKAGFLTALYMVLVPIFSGMLGKKIGKNVWMAVAVALGGLYFLCINGPFVVERGDAYLVSCAFGFAVQILLVSYFIQYMDTFTLSCGEFFATGIFSIVLALATEDRSAVHLQACILPFLYLVLLSNCVAYTLQIYAEKKGNPTIVSLLFSLESVFALLGGVVLLNERMSGRELFGCALMMAAVIIAELPESGLKKKGRS